MAIRTSPETFEQAVPERALRPTRSQAQGISPSTAGPGALRDPQKADPPMYPATYPIDTVFHSVAIPGTGNQTKPDCGTFRTGSDSAYACSKDASHYKTVLQFKCWKISCPSCFPAALTRASKRIAQKIRGYRARVDSLGLDVNPDFAAHHRAMAIHLNHFVLSPPVGKYAENTECKKIVAASRRIAAHVGIEGGMMALHPWRIKDKIKPRLGHRCKKVELMTDETKEKKFWALIREDVLGLGSWREYICWSPHVHVLGYGYLPSQETPEEKTAFKKLTKGWFVKKIKRGAGYDIEQPALVDCFNGQEVEDPIAAVAYYILSHAAYRPGYNLYSYLGFFNPSKLRKGGKQKTDKVPVVCPKCNSPVVFGEDICEGFKYSPGSRGDLWKPHLLTLGHQEMLIMGIDPPPEKKKNILEDLPGCRAVAADVAPSSGSWLFDKWGQK